MIIKQLPSFASWLESIRDKTTKGRIVNRIARLADGLFGDAHSVGDGVSELRIHLGPGYRLYYTIREQTIVILLVGGTKSSQDQDIAKSKALAKEIP